MSDELELEDLDIEEVDIDYGFSEEDFEGGNHRGRKIKKGRKKSYAQYIIGAVALVIIAIVVIRIAIWNKGVASDYNPDEDTSEYDVEPTDYIQPLSAEQLAGKVDDGKLTFLMLGNSPFADNYWDNNLAKAIGETYGAEVINAGFEDSYITQSTADYSIDEPEDGISLYQVSKAIASGDFSIVKEAAATQSDTVKASADILSGVDMTSIDAIFIMYNLEDYQDHRPLGSEDKEDITCIYGALYSSIKNIQEAYPYIRIVYLSQPAGGVTIDNFFVDGDVHDIGCGTLYDYVTFETEAVASRGASFIDVYYGAINVDDRDKYLVDDYHINDDGAKAIANRVKKLITF